MSFIHLLKLNKGLDGTISVRGKVSGVVSHIRVFFFFLPHSLTRSKKIIKNWILFSSFFFFSLLREVRRGRMLPFRPSLLWHLSRWYVVRVVRNVGGGMGSCAWLDSSDFLFSRFGLKGGR